MELLGAAVDASRPRFRGRRARQCGCNLRAELFNCCQFLGGWLLPKVGACLRKERQHVVGIELRLAITARLLRGPDQLIGSFHLARQLGEVAIDGRKLALQLAALAAEPSLDVVLGQIQYVAAPGFNGLPKRLRHVTDPVVHVNLGSGVFRKRAFDAIGAGRWTSMVLGIAGSYGKDDSVDVTYRAGGRSKVAARLPLETVETRDE